LYMAKSDDITIRFPLNKSEGPPPLKSEFSEEELADLRSCLALSICWEPQQIRKEAAARICSAEFLYDGITRFNGEEFGYWFEEGVDELCGYPAPIIRFRLDHKVDPGDFARALFGTSLRLLTSSMHECGADPFYAEDHNGYTSALTHRQRDRWVEYLDGGRVLCGKTFVFPDGMSEHGHLLPAIEFSSAPRG
jgi:hypothetical protein